MSKLSRMFFERSSRARSAEWASNVFRISSFESAASDGFLDTSWSSLSIGEK